MRGMGVIDGFGETGFDWDNNSSWKSKKIRISGKTIKNDGSGCASIFLSRILDSEVTRFACRFKIIKAHHGFRDIWFGIYKINVGNPKINDCFSKTKNGSSYCFISDGHLENTNSPGNSLKKYGIKINQNDYIEMVIWQGYLSYFINGKCYGNAFEIEDTKYKIGVCLNSGNSVQLK